MSEQRIVPLLLRLRILLENEIVVALFICALGFYAIYATGVSGDLTRHTITCFPTRTIKGVLLADASTYRVNKTDKCAKVYMHRVRYQAGSRTFYSICYSTSVQWLPRTVKVHYSPFFPACSRVDGMADVSSWPAFGVLGVLFAVSVLLFAIVLPKRLRMIRLLKAGQVTDACMIKRDERTTYENGKGNRKLICYIFRYKADDGDWYTVKTLPVEGYDKSLEDTPMEPVVYDPNNPKVAFMLDNIPGKPRIDDMGVVRDSCPWTALFTVAAAVISLIPFGQCVKQVLELLY